MKKVCAICNQDFPTSRALDRHLTSHKKIMSKEQYYEKYSDDAIRCAICDKMFSSPRALKSHIKSHSDVITEAEYYDKYLSGTEKCAYIHCGCDLGHDRFAGKFCSSLHYESHKRIEKYGKLDWLCPICKWGTAEDPDEHSNLVGKIAFHLTKVHNFDIKQMEEFYNQYIKKDDDPDGHCLWCNKELEFKNLTDGYDKFCYNTSCNVLWHNKHTGRQDKAIVSVKAVYTTQPERLHTRKEYWMAKGFSEEDAIQMVSERQSTFTLEKCIEKHGKVEGTKVWQELDNLYTNIA